jgi:hypothetical protein
MRQASGGGEEVVNQRLSPALIDSRPGALFSASERWLSRSGAGPEYERRVCPDVGGDRRSRAARRFALYPLVMFGQPNEGGEA